MAERLTVTNDEFGGWTWRYFNGADVLVEEQGNFPDVDACSAAAAAAHPDVPIQGV